MRMSTIAFGAAALFFLTACGGSSGVTNTPDSTGAGGDSSSTSSAAPTAAKVGSPITLKGSGDGEQIQVTLVKVVPVAKATDGFSKPQQGNAFYAAQWIIKNTGTAPYEDSPSNGSKVIDSTGQQFDTTFADTNCGPSFGGSVKLLPGKVAKGCLTYEIAKTSKITSAQFSTASGFGETGEWNIG